MWYAEDGEKSEKIHKIAESGKWAIYTSVTSITQQKFPISLASKTYLTKKLFLGQVFDFLVRNKPNLVL
tara:strand:+ start:675 stop:881 length:207 start_codon:yes stop_codon:yes gene_type:complete